MVVAVIEMRNPTVAVHQGAGGFGFQKRLGWFLQLGLYVLLYRALVGGLYWPTSLACSASISLTDGTIG